MLDGTWNFFEHITQAWEHPIKRDVKEFYKLRPVVNELGKKINRVLIRLYILYI